MKDDPNAPGSEPARQEPRTVGELRRRLADMGKPWEPDARLTDADPIPHFPTGGDGPTPQTELPSFQGDLEKHLQSTPPTNPFLREHWRERGLLAEEPRLERARDDDQVQGSG